MKDFKNIKRALTFSLLLVGIIFSSCKSIKDSEGLVESPQIIETNIEEQSVLYGSGGEGFSQGVYVIKSNSDWADFLGKIDKVNETSQKFKNLNVDFGEEMIVAYFDKVRPSGGYKVSLVNASSLGNEIHIGVREEAPSGEATTVMTQPFFLVSMPTSNKTVLFDIIEL